MFNQLLPLLTLLVVIGCIYAFYLKFLAPLLYWKRRGVYHINLYYRFLRIFLSDASFLEVIRNDYDSFPDRRYYGSYQFLRPSLFVRDVELIKKITVRDFDHFHDHATISDYQGSDPVVTQNLFALKGNAWRNMRATLSPAFTSSKMRQMFTLMAQTAETFTNYALKDSEDGKCEIEMKDFYSRYSNDVIASCAFGIECDSLKNKDNEFYRMGKMFASAFTGLRVLKGLLIVLFPSIMRVLNVGIFPGSVTDFFKRMVKDTINYREKEGVVRPDLIHLLIQARKGQLKEDSGDFGNAGYASVEETETRMDPDGKMELTDDLITAQALVFFFAGFETSSTLLGLVSYELARNPDIQQKLQKEIDANLEVTNGEIHYDAILKMKYLDQVVSEALRLYPPGIALSRVCTKDYPVPAKRANEKDFVLEKDCLLLIPVYGVHMCPDFFPNPDKFDPDRFSEANKANVIAGTYMPFGSGPRNCIGSRFALLETKALIVSLMSKLNVVVTEKTEVPITFAKTPLLGPKNGIWLALEKRQI